MICKKCGAINETDTWFCCSCGNRFENDCSNEKQTTIKTSVSKTGDFLTEMPDYEDYETQLIDVEAVVAGSVITCDKCGATNNSNAMFCYKCKEKLLDNNLTEQTTVLKLDDILKDNENNNNLTENKKDNMQETKNLLTITLSQKFKKIIESRKSVLIDKEKKRKVKKFFVILIIALTIAVLSTIGLYFGYSHYNNYIMTNATEESDANSIDSDILDDYSELPEAEITATETVDEPETTTTETVDEPETTNTETVDETESTYENSSSITEDDEPVSEWIENINDGNENVSLLYYPNGDIKIAIVYNSNNDPYKVKFFDYQDNGSYFEKYDFYIYLDGERVLLNYAENFQERTSYYFQNEYICNVNDLKEEIVNYYYTEFYEHNAQSFEYF